jgi:carbon storage regulator
MLIISRKTGESITMQTPEGEVTVTVLGIQSNDGIRVGIEAPKKIPIYREEVFLKIQKEKDEN